MIQEPAEPFLTGDRSGGWLRASSLNQSVPQALVASLKMVVFHVALERSPEVPFSTDRKFKGPFVAGSEVGRGTG